jgi:hypothetical protein
VTDTTLTVAGDRLRIDAPTGLGRASLLGALDVPVAHVTAVDLSAEPMSEIRGWREGIGLPHLRMGTWRHDNVKDYVSVRAGEPGLVITLHDEAFTRVIVSTSDAAALAEAIAALLPDAG